MVDETVIDAEFQDVVFNTEADEGILTEEDAPLELTPEDQAKLDGLVEYDESWKAFTRMQKKINSGRTVTKQEAFQAMMDMRTMVMHMASDAQSLFQMLQQQERATQYMMDVVGVLIEVLTRNNVITNEQFKTAFTELVVKPRQEAMVKAQEEAEQRARQDAAADVARRLSEEAEGRKMPDCRYCGQPECQFCNPENPSTEPEPITE